MRIAAIYDIHGNLPALEAVLADIASADVDQIVVGGDVLPGPMPRECLELMHSQALDVKPIKGNGERETLAMLCGEGLDNVPESFHESIRWVGKQLDRELIDWISQWPASVSLPSRCGDILFCHATPRNDFEIFTRETPAEHLKSAFEGVTEANIVCGHTHMPFDRMVGGYRVINAGSVGMPFGSTDASWLLIDDQLYPRQTEYDLQAAAERIRKTEFPIAEFFVTNHILSSPDESEMIAVYEKASIRK